MADLAGFIHHADDEHARVRAGYTSELAVLFSLDGTEILTIRNDPEIIESVCKLLWEVAANGRLLKRRKVA
jgi:hypothetical protein